MKKPNRPALRQIYRALKERRAARELLAKRLGRQPEDLLMIDPAHPDLNAEAYKEHSVQLEELVLALERALDAAL